MAETEQQNTAEHNMQKEETKIDQDQLQSFFFQRSRSCDQAIQILPNDQHSKCLLLKTNRDEREEEELLEQKESEKQQQRKAMEMEQQHNNTALKKRSKKKQQKNKW